MSDIKEQAQERAEDALRRWFHGEGYTAVGHYENPGECSACHEAAEVAVDASAPFIAAQELIEERRRSVDLVRRRLVPRGCEPTKDAADLIDAIKGGLDV